MNIYRITAIGRPLDLSYATNRWLLYLLPILALLGAGLAWRQGADLAAVTLLAFRTALLGFAAWALGRELAPDDQAAAFLAIAVALTTIPNVPEPGFLLLFLALALARVLNRSTGVTLKPTDALAVLGLAAATAHSHGTPVPLAITAVAFAWGAALPHGPRWQVWASAGAALGAVAVGLLQGTVLARGAPLSTHGIVLPAVFGVGFLLTLLATRDVQAVGDVDREPLSPRRVRAGMWIVLALAAGNLAQGSPLAAKGVALWAVLGGVALGRVIWVLSRLRR